MPAASQHVTGKVAAVPLLSTFAAVIPPVPKRPSRVAAVRDMGIDKESFIAWYKEAVLEAALLIHQQDLDEGAQDELRRVRLRLVWEGARAALIWPFPWAAAGAGYSSDGVPEARGL